MDNSDKSAGLDGSIARCSMPSNATHAILMESIFEPNANEDSGLASRNFQLDAVHAGASRNVERVAIFVAPGHVAHIFPSRLVYCNEQIDLLTYTNLQVNPTSFKAALRACSDPTAFAGSLEISANLRKPGELTNPPVEERRQ